MSAPRRQPKGLSQRIQARIVGGNGSNPAPATNRCSEQRLDSQRIGAFFFSLGKTRNPRGWMLRVATVHTVALKSTLLGIASTKCLSCFLAVGRGREPALFHYRYKPFVDLDEDPPNPRPAEPPYRHESFWLAGIPGPCTKAATQPHPILRARDRPFEVGAPEASSPFRCIHSLLRPAFRAVASIQSPSQSSCRDCLTATASAWA